MTKETVFVYGTLRKHERYHPLLSRAECLAEQCWTYGLLYDTGQGYPALLRNNDRRVYGELYRVTERELHDLDQLEGYAEQGSNNLYERVSQRVYTDRGPVEAYVYLYNDRNGATLTPIGLGDWKCRGLLEEDEFLYFAYGSCMDNKRFQLHGVEPLFGEIVGVGRLDGYSLRYTHHSASDGMGRADLMEIGGTAEGKVYRINQEALQYLFRREGVESGSYRPALIDLEVKGQQMKEVLTFFVVNKKEEIAPPKSYALEILRGGKCFLSEDYLAELREHLKEKFSMVMEDE